jgi:hypothetical protein
MTKIGGHQKMAGVKSRCAICKTDRRFILTIIFNFMGSGRHIDSFYGIIINLWPHHKTNPIRILATCFVFWGNRMLKFIKLTAFTAIFGSMALQASAAIVYVTYSGVVKQDGNAYD